MTRKYLENGQEVELIQECAGNYLVSSIFYDDESEEEAIGDPFVVKKLYDKPPVEKYNAEILKLQSQVEALSKQKTELNAEKYKLENERKSFEKDTTYPKIFIAMKKFLEGKIKHVVYRMELLTTEEYLKKLNSEYDPWDRKISLYFSGWFNGKPSECQISYDIKFYETYDEALKEIQNQINQKIKEYGLDDHKISLAAKYNIEIPAEKLIEYRNKKRAKRISDISELKAKITKIETELKELEDGPIARE